ncbi:hypothetical protein SPLC1_S410670 [Arthrospira platensis C1]|nr:hypothetical protein SPLC1_S410670 [Arthrospira platensis C1]
MLKTNQIISLLLIFIPISIVAEYGHWGATIIFITAALAIIPPGGLDGYSYRRNSSSSRP